MPDTAAIIAKYSQNIPRYTSYPTAPHFRNDEGGRLVETMLSSIGQHERISLYLHIPFCDKLCWFCGCHTKHTLQYAPVEAYVGSLVEEIRLVSQRIGFKAALEHVHFGGGSPSMLERSDFQRLREALETAFAVDEKTEISVEVDPSDVKPGTIEGLSDLGITRGSIGVQDFHPEVQAAINRPQSFELTRDVVIALREAGVRSLNIDALYGLPLQTRDRMEDTILKVIELKPDRTAIFGYAHVPWMKKHQQMIRDEDLPDGLQRLQQAERAGWVFATHGYERIGFDHFALPHDSMAVAAREGRLHRNFQGYTTDACDTLIGLGASSISKFRGGYLQNIVATNQYREAVAEGRLTASKGFELSQDDIVRAFMIERLMCDFEIDPAMLEAQFGAVANPYIREIQLAAASEADGLCRMQDGKFVVPAEMRQFVRIVAAKFDAYLKDSGFRYSRAV